MLNVSHYLIYQDYERYEFFTEFKIGSFFF